MTAGWDTFDRNAASYGAVRPAYPEAVFDAIESYSRCTAVPYVLEIGAGSGQATRQMAARGWSVVALEPGPTLADAARHELVGRDEIEVRTVRFEDARLESGAFDLVASATAWHWVDPMIGIPKSAQLLKPAGTLALWWNAHDTDTTDPRWVPIRRVYERAAPHLARLAPLTPDRPDYDPRAELEATGVFTELEEHSFPFSISYTAAEFLALISTYASHRTLDDEARRQLHSELAAAIEGELAGVVTKPYNCFLVLGRPVAASSD